MKFIRHAATALAALSIAASAFAQTNELQECEAYNRRYLPNQPVHCGPYSIKVNTPAQNSSYRGVVRIGGFNLKHLGTASDAIARDYDAVSEMINQWDVVGVLELEDWSNSNLEHNTALDAVLQARPDWLQQIMASFAIPGQITLLKALQAHDPSWAFMMTTTPQGELGNDGTISAAENGLQYYRGSKVSPIPLKYCGGDFACAQRFVPAEAPLVSRSPLVAGYRTAKHNFILASTHTRFNPPVRSDSAESFEQGLDRLYLSEVKARVRKLSEPERVKLFGGNEPAGGWLTWLDTFNRGQIREIAKRMGFYTSSMLGYRLAETWVVMGDLDRISAHESIPSVIFQGDFNLEPGDFARFSESFFASKGGAWPNAKVYVEENTSISTKIMNGQYLANSYDHFIFDPAKAPECNGAGAQTFNFTAMNRYMGQQLQTRAKRAVDQTMARLRASYKATSATELGPRYSQGDLARFADIFDKGLLNAPASAMNQPIFRLYSDHIPIWMECDFR